MLRLITLGFLLLTVISPASAQILGFSSGAPIGPQFTTVLPTSPVCQGLNSSCAGSQVIYISESTGTDPGTPTTGDCTQSAPCKSLLFGCEQLRNNSSDQLLLKGGDVWPTTDHCGHDATHGIENINGVSACSSPWTIGGGGNCSGPILFGVYNSSSGRPEIDTNSSSPLGNSCWSIGGGSTYNNIVVQGWYCHSLDRDPTLASYTFTGNSDGGAGLGSTLSFTTTWILVEDCKFAYYDFDISISGANGTVIIRRNIITHAMQAAGDSSGVFVQGASAPYFEDNFYYMDGWDNILSAPQSVTVSGSTVTWPISNYAFDTLPFSNGSQVYFQSTCGSAVAGTAYTVSSANSSAGTFQVGVSLSGCSTATMQWSDLGIGLGLLNHATYDDWTSGPSTYIGNITIWTNDLMDRPGGTATGNFVSNDPIEMTAGAFVGCCGGGETTITSLNFSQNVLQHPLAAYPGVNQFTYPGDGGDGYAIDNASGSGIQMVHNIFSQLGTGASGGLAFEYSTGTANNDVNNTVNQNNIIYGANSGGAFSLNDGTGNVTTPQTCIDLSEANSGCSDEPFPHPLYDVFSYDSTQIGGPGTCSGTGPPTPSGASSVIGSGNNCMADFVNQETLRAPGVWPTNLTAGAIITYVKGGFGNPF